MKICKKNKIVKPAYFNISNKKNSILENESSNNEKPFAQLNKMEEKVRDIKADILSHNTNNNTIIFKDLNKNGKN